MNEIETLNAKVKEFPKSRTKLYKPSAKGSGWVLDINLGARIYIVVTWSPTAGFGVSTPVDDEPYGLPASETYADFKQTFSRVIQLLKTGAKAGQQEMALPVLREHRDVSQEVLAKKMKKSQAAVSQTENRDDIRLSTLREYVQGLGGELQVFARFSDETIELAVDKD